MFQLEEVGGASVGWCYVHCLHGDSKVVVWVNSYRPEAVLVGRVRGGVARGQEGA